MVFTYKGEDISDTILRFAREYRVGHIVIGSPGPLPFWKRLLRRRNIVERLIESAEGITVVVLGTRKYEIPKSKVPVVMPAQYLVEPALSKRPASQFSLSRMLSPRRIIIWNEPVMKEEVLRTLVEAVENDGGIGDFSFVLDQVIKSEQKGSTFFNEGAAFPHVRVRGLSLPQVSLGLTHKGVVDVSTDNPIECVFLILSPAEAPEVQLRLLSTMSRAAQSRYLLWNLRSARTPEEALEDLYDWETFQEPRAVQ
jgi:two-component system, OmpR family, sensor histidine kinase KdpD